MEYTKTQLGFKESDILEKLIFTSEEKYQKSFRFAQRNNIHFVEWEVDVSGHYNTAILARAKDTAKFKATYDQFKDIKTGLLS